MKDIYNFIEKLTITKWVKNLTFILLLIKFTALLRIDLNWIVVFIPIIVLTIVLIIMYLYGSRRLN